MKPFPLMCAGLLLLVSSVPGKPAKPLPQVSVAVQAFNCIKTVQKYHYAPRPVDNNFSAAVYRSFFRLLDPYGLLITAEAIAKLDTFKCDIDDQIKQQKTGFLNAATVVYAAQLGVVDSLIKVLKGRKFDLTVSDTLWLNDTVYSRQGDLLKKWEQWVKYMVLWSHQSHKDSSDTAALPGQKELATVLEEVLAREACRVQVKKELPGGVKEQTSRIYLKAIANTFDPHTEYLSAAEKEMFETDLSTESNQFGIQLNFNTIGEIEISAVQPGGPAWNSNKLNEGDVILGIKKPDGSMLDLRCVNLPEVQRYLASIGDKNAGFKVRKKNGKIVNVSLKKEIIEVEENSIQSFVLKGNIVAGYVYLPSFYSDYAYQQYFSKGCANDLARELVKLKAVPIKGLILDLRSNGGGSMWEATRMAGSFIDIGALCITHSRDKDPETVKDIARGTVWGGPVIVLVNSFSASAAELLAGCLQDYNRALIIGSTTYGKSTVQRTVPVDAGNFDSLSLYKGEPPGFLNLTISSLYRVTGTSHQKTGVTPDIALPELLGQSLGREISYDNALEFAKINKKSYYYPVASLPIAALKSLSEKRVAENGGFNEIKKYAEQMPRKNARYPVPLAGRSFAEYVHRFDKPEDTLAEKECPFATTLPKYAGGKTIVTDQDKADNDDLMQAIRNDRYITEAYYIMNDLIKLSTKSEGK